MHDIKAIYKPSADVNFLHRLYREGFCSSGYEVKYIKPVEEVTLAQVCKELGRDVKIIK